jgi:hypothetical protein
MTIKMAFEKISVKALKRFSADIAVSSFVSTANGRNLLSCEVEINSG